MAQKPRPISELTAAMGEVLLLAESIDPNTTSRAFVGYRDELGRLTSDEDLPELIIGFVDIPYSTHSFEELRMKAVACGVNVTSIFNGVRSLASLGSIKGAEWACRQIDATLNELAGVLEENAGQPDPVTNPNLMDLRAVREILNSDVFMDVDIDWNAVLEDVCEQISRPNLRSVA